MTPNATTQTEALLLTETKDGVATLTLNRPGQFNALSSALIDELQTTFDRLAADPAVSVVVLAANGRDSARDTISRRSEPWAMCATSSRSSRAAAG